MYDKKNKYRDVPNDDPIFTKIDQLQNTTKDVQVIRDTECLNMSLAHLHFPIMTCHWKGEEHFNSLLKKYNIDVNKYLVGQEKVKEGNPSFKYIISIMRNNEGEYKSEIIKLVLKELPNIKKGRVRSAIKKYCRLGILEQTKHETSNKTILKKGRYWNSHISKEV